MQTICRDRGTSSSKLATIFWAPADQLAGFPRQRHAVQCIQADNNADVDHLENRLRLTVQGGRHTPQALSHSLSVSVSVSLSEEQNRKGISRYVHA